MVPHPYRGGTWAGTNRRAASHPGGGGLLRLPEDGRAPGPGGWPDRAPDHGMADRSGLAAHQLAWRRLLAGS